MTAMYHTILIDGVIPSSEDGISESIYSKPNQGLLSVPEKPIININAGNPNDLKIDLILGGMIPFHTKEIAADLYFSEVIGEDGYVSLEVNLEKLHGTKINNVIWEKEDSRILRQGEWNIRITPELLEEFSGAVELRVRAKNFIGESEMSVMNLRY